MTLFLKKSYWYPQKYGHQQLVLYQYSCFKNVWIKWIIGILCMVAFAVSPAKMMQGKSKCKKTIIWLLWFGRAQPIRFKLMKHIIWLVTHHVSRYFHLSFRFNPGLYNSWKLQLTQTKKQLSGQLNCLICCVVPLGLEPRTPWLWVRCSNQLSYGTVRLLCRKRLQRYGVSANYANGATLFSNYFAQTDVKNSKTKAYQRNKHCYFTNT